MKIFELYLKDKAKGIFTLEELEILNNQLMGYYYVDKENATKEEEFKEFENYISRKTIKIKDDLILTLEQYIEADEGEETLAEMDLCRNEDVITLIETLEQLTNEEIIEILFALMRARDFFNMFLPSDPIEKFKMYRYQI
ncbi:UNVERIFIED_CONTAM: hypothetical protein Cloal_1016 [Acetivibrio alkalicellulosi]